MPENAEFDAFLKAWERKGRLLVQAIVLLNAVLVVAAFVSALLAGAADAMRFLAMLFWLFVSTMLYRGRRWAKWLFVIAAAINAVGMVGLVPSLMRLPAVSTAAVLAVAIGLLGAASMAVSALLLLFSGAVNDFLDGQRRLEDARAAAEMAQQPTRKHLSD